MHFCATVLATCGSTLNEEERAVLNTNASPLAKGQVKIHAGLVEVSSY